MNLSNKCIVVIDDTISILTFLRISLESMGATFHGAATAAGGLSLCESTQPDLVILDLGLPDREGINILPRIKRLVKDGNLPVIVLTAHKEQEILDMAMELGADAYITKPFVVDDLIKTIQAQLQIRQDAHLKLVKREDNPANISIRINKV